jgi:tyrosine-specific transport protein
VITSFLAVALCLVDFLADGLKMEKKGAKGLFVHLATFIPPLVIVLLSPGIFVTALQYAGINCAILLILLPDWMAWAGRYRRKVSAGYRVIGGKPLLSMLMGFGALLIMRSMLVILG